MKLTNYMRDAFIRRVMNDVPQIDYDERIRALTLKIALALAPPAVRKLWADPEQRRWLNTSSVFVGSRSVMIPTPEAYDARETHKEAVKADGALKDLCAVEASQAEQRKTLETKLRSVAYSVTTRKALADALPEFVKYLPPDEAAAIRTLPVVANVVADFIKAGWPKDKVAA
jgi:hypothetical protein